MKKKEQKEQKEQKCKKKNKFKSMGKGDGKPKLPVGHACTQWNFFGYQHFVILI
jgi:hypothetical protein